MVHYLSLFTCGGEQQRFFTLFKDVVSAYRREPGEMDISLVVLALLTTKSARAGLGSRE